MSTRLSFTLPAATFAAATAFLIAAPAALEALPAPAPQKPVMRVRAASAKLIKPHVVQVCARGVVPTAGWTNAQLRPVIYVQAPPNGIYDFDFVATPPTGIVPQVVTPIKAIRIWTPSPAGLHGVRIKGAGNSVTAMLNQGPSAC